MHGVKPCVGLKHALEVLPHVWGYTMRLRCCLRMHGVKPCVGLKHALEVLPAHAWD